jgi:hypothetical protein
MKLIPSTPEVLGVVPRIIWFEPPERALADPIRFMAYAMTYARHEDMRVIRRHVSDDDFREALDRAPPGIIDQRSWAYWNSKMGRYPPPPLPVRHLGGGAASVGSTALAGQTNSAPVRDLESLRREGRESWLKMRQHQPKEDLEEVRLRQERRGSAFLHTVPEPGCDSGLWHHGFAR